MISLLLALTSTFSDETGCLDSAALERELQARAPTAQVDVRVMATAEGRVAKIIVTNLTPNVEREIAIRDVECDELARAIAFIAAAALADRDVLDGPELFVDEVPAAPAERSGAVAEFGDGADDAATPSSPTAGTAARARTGVGANDSAVFSPLVSGGVAIGLTAPLLLDVSVGVGTQIAVGNWRPRVQLRARQTTPAPLAATFASLTSLTLAGSVGLRVDVADIALVPRAGVDLGVGLAWRVDGKQVAFVPRADACAGIDVELGPVTVGIEARAPLLPFVLIDREQRSPEPLVWAGVGVGTAF